MTLFPLPNKFRRALAIAGALVLLIALATTVWVTRQWQAPLAITEPVTIEVSQGSSLSRVSRELAEAGYLAHPRLFVLLARWRGVSNAIKTGEYRLEPGLSAASLLDKLVAGDNLQYRVTLVEGWTIAQALDAIWAGERISRNLLRFDPGAIARLLGLEHDNPEGMLFPDTYFYTAGTTDEALLRRAHARLNEVLTQAWEERLGALPLTEPYEALILASIVEKETAIAAERDRIAGVFVRRLELGMRLQSDPTVLYGMAASFIGDITREDLSTTTPYNTYRINGLPPTPIALAGLGAIRAVTRPEMTESLYFVARGDGSHHFSATLEEHNAAVTEFQRSLSSDAVQGVTDQ